MPPRVVNGRSPQAILQEWIHVIIQTLGEYVKVSTFYGHHKSYVFFWSRLRIGVCLCTGIKLLIWSSVLLNFIILKLDVHEGLNSRAADRTSVTLHPNDLTASLA